MSFILTPPVLTRKSGYGVSLYQFGDDESPETTLLIMNEWTSVDFLRFWREEIRCLLDGVRSNALLVTCLYKNSDGDLFPGERWEIFKHGDDFLLNEICAVDFTEPHFILPVDKWWTIASPPSLSEQNSVHPVLTRDEMEKWCLYCDWLLCRIEITDEDVVYCPLLASGRLEKSNHFKVRNGERILEIDVPPNLFSRTPLFNFYAEVLEYPSFSIKTWEEFGCVIENLSYMPVKKIIIKHQDCPLDGNERERYIDILKSLNESDNGMLNAVKISIVFPTSGNLPEDV